MLDVACGEGRNSVWLASLGCDVLGVDVSPLALDEGRTARDRAKGVAVRWSEADIRNWQWEPARFDAVVCIFIQFAEPGERARLFDGFKVTLKPGGMLVLQGYTPKQARVQDGWTAAGQSYVHRCACSEMVSPAWKSCICKNTRTC